MVNFVKGQLVNVLGFVDLTVSVTTTLLCSATGNREADECGQVPEQNSAKTKQNRNSPQAGFVSSSLACMLRSGISGPQVSGLFPKRLHQINKHQKHISVRGSYSFISCPEPRVFLKQHPTVVLLCISLILMGLLIVFSALRNASSWLLLIFCCVVFFIIH